MKNTIYNVCILLLGAFCVLACTNESTTSERTETTQGRTTYQMLINSDTAIYSMLTDFKLEDNSGDYQKENITKIVLCYPHIDSFKNRSIVDSVNKIILNAILSDAVGLKPPTTTKEYMNIFIGDYKDYKKEMKEFGLHFSSVWFYDLKITVLLNAPNLISLKVNKLEFTGGAHANPWTSYLNIDLRTGKIINLNDCLLGDYESQLLVSAEAAFRKATNLELSANLTETPYEFSSGSFELPEHFSIGKNGLSFYYNSYDLGPYASGATSFEVPYDELVEVLNKDKLGLIGVVTKG